MNPQTRFAGHIFAGSARVALIPAQTNKNLATNAIKGLSIPSRPLAKVRSDTDNKINIFGIFMI